MHFGLFFTLQQSTERRLIFPAPIHARLFQGGNMLRKNRFIMVLFAVLALTLVASSTAYAHFCTPADKPIGPGSIGVYNVVAESFTPNRENIGNFNNGGFITFTDGATFTYDIFIHQFLPEGALASGPGGDDLCDGQGIDFALACLGIVP
jgi:hypothetical protein